MRIAEACPQFAICNSPFSLRAQALYVRENPVLQWELLTNLRIAFGVLAVAAAVAIGVANLRNLFGRR